MGGADNGAPLPRGYTSLLQNKSLVSSPQQKHDLVHGQCHTAQDAESQLIALLFFFFSGRQNVKEGGTYVLTGWAPVPGEWTAGGVCSSCQAYSIYAIGAAMATVVLAPC